MTKLKYSILRLRIPPAITAAYGILLFGVIYGGSGAYKFSKHGDPSIGVERDSNLPRGNCNQCHFQHDGDLPNDFGLFSANDNRLCQSSGCHEYELQWPPGDYHWSYPGDAPDWYNSAHGASSDVFPPGSSREVRLCLQCHDPHGENDSTSGVYPSATKHLEERGCYSNNGITGGGCHGLNDTNRPLRADDIYSMTLKISKHDFEAQAKKHSSDWSVNYPYGREPRTTSSGFFSGDYRHVECVDCHNPHKAIPGEHVPATNNIGGPLLGSWGVEPINGGPWTIPTTYSAVDFTNLMSAKEYQLCFKCHSYFAFADTPPAGYTDVAREFNPANASYHPVEDYIPTNSYTSPSPGNGFIETMESPWDNGTHDLMVCSDCHSSDTATDPKGPHGSDQLYILIGSPNATDIDFCTTCHKGSIYAPTSDPRNSETGSRFDKQTTDDGKASHWFHVTKKDLGCRQCHGGRQNPPIVSINGNNEPLPIEVGSIHGSNTFSGFMNGTNIKSYAPGSCWPTCHGRKTYDAGPE